MFMAKAQFWKNVLDSAKSNRYNQPTPSMWQATRKAMGRVEGKSPKGQAMGACDREASVTVLSKTAAL